MPGKRHLPHTGGGDDMGRQRGSPWQELQAVRVPRGPSRHCSFAERDETPGSPASISSPTYGWEKQNCSNGASRVEGSKGWMVGGWGVPLASAAATSALGTGAEPPSQVLGSGTHLWVHHSPHHAQLSPLAGPPTSPSTTSMGSQKSTESIAGSR